LSVDSYSLEDFVSDENERTVISIVDEHDVVDFA
jgi:hypothetical protein